MLSREETYEIGIGYRHHVLLYVLVAFYFFYYLILPVVPNECGSNFSKYSYGVCSSTSTRMVLYGTTESTIVECTTGNKFLQVQVVLASHLALYALPGTGVRRYSHLCRILLAYEDKEKYVVLVLDMWCVLVAQLSDTKHCACCLASHLSSVIRSNTIMTMIDLSAYSCLKRREDDEELINESRDRVAVLSQLEKKHYRPSVNYLSTDTFVDQVSCFPSESEKVTEVWRQKVCEWCYQVIDHFYFNREVVFIALNFLDRMVAELTCRAIRVRKSDFRLMAVTSLYLAVKLHGVHSSQDGVRRKLRISSFYELSERHFSIQEIEAMERNMLSVLEWHVNPPTPSMYTEYLLALCPKWRCNESSLTCDSVLTSIKDITIYLTELAVSDAGFTFTVAPIMCTYAAVLCAAASQKSYARLPQDVKDVFFDRMAVATELDRSDPEVLSVKRQLIDLFPEILGEEDSVPEGVSIPGNTSPVCVMDDSLRLRSVKRKQNQSISE
jgi:Cyclin, N-terminal domain